MRTSGKSNKMSKSKSLEVTPAIALERPEPKEYSSQNFLSNKCYSTPGDANSNTYNVSVQYFEEGTPEEWLQLLAAHKRICQGQNINNGPGTYNALSRHLKGTILSKYNTVQEARGNQTLEHFNLVAADLTAHVFPSKAYVIQKRYMKKFIKKPRDMKIRALVSRIQELNNYLPSFPPSVSETAPTKLPDDELKEIVYNALPSSWQVAMTTQGFDYPNEDIQDIIGFCERYEILEEDPIPRKKRGKESSKSTSKSKKRKIRFESSSEDSDDDSTVAYKYCQYHGKCNHTTEQCIDIKRLISDDKRRKRNNRYSEKKRYNGKNHKDREYKKKRKSGYVKRSEVNILATKKLKKYLRKKMKKEKPMEELQNFEKIKLSDDEKSEKSLSSESSNSSSKAGDIEDVSDWSSICSSNSDWKTGSDENFVTDDIRSTSKRIKLEKEVFTCLDDCINNNFNYESIRSRLVSQGKNKNRVENNNLEDLIPIVFGTIVRNSVKKIRF